MNGPTLGSVLGKGIMASITGIIGNVFTKQTPEMYLPKDNHMIEDVLSTTSHPTFMENGPPPTPTLIAYYGAFVRFRVLPQLTVVYGIFLPLQGAFTRRITVKKIRHKKRVTVPVNTSRKLSLFETRPACMAGVRISLPNLKAEWGRMKL